MNSVNLKALLILTLVGSSTLSANPQQDLTLLRLQAESTLTQHASSLQSLLNNYNRNQQRIKDLVLLVQQTRGEEKFKLLEEDEDLLHAQREIHHDIQERINPVLLKMILDKHITDALSEKQSKDESKDAWYLLSLIERCKKIPELNIDIEVLRRLFREKLK